MLITRRFRLVTSLLASKRNNDPDDPRKIFHKLRKPPRDEDPEKVYIVSDLGRWEWAFLEARDALELSDVAVSSILPSHWYAVKRTSTYNRKFKSAGGWRTDKFEAVIAGQVFEMKFTLSGHIPPNTDGNGRFTRPPSEEEFDGMLAHIGEYLGMSEWGHSRKYGRFHIQQHFNNNDKPSDSGPAGEEDRPPVKPPFRDLGEAD